jgi:hypothetical protein
MSHKDQHHDRGHQHKHEKPARRGLHRDWRLWAAVVLMLTAMGVYILTLDESIGLGGGGVEQPAATGDAE